MATATGVTTPTAVPPPPEPAGPVWVSNVTDTGLVLSWASPFTSTGRAVVVPVDGGSPITAVDGRGASYAGDTHYIPVSGLLPATRYRVTISSGDAMTPTAVLTVATGPTIDPSPTVDTLSGFLFEHDGITPAAGAIVYLRVEDADGQGSPAASALLSTVTGSDGAWLIALPPRRLDLQDYFAFGDGDRFRLVAEGGHRGTLLRQLSAGGPRSLRGLSLVPAFAVSLMTGWTNLALPNGEVGPYTAESLLVQMEAQGNGVQHIARWENGAWQSHLGGFAANDFPIEVGRGYFVRSSNYGVRMARPLVAPPAPTP